MRHWRATVGDKQRIKLDKAVALFLVVPCDLGACGQLVAAASCGEKLHSAADMNPRSENGIVDQYSVHDPLQQPGMTEAFSRVDRVALTYVSQIFLRRLPQPRRAARGRATSRVDRKTDRPAFVRRQRLFR